MTAIDERSVVVVADDDHAIRSLYRQALEREGFIVKPAANGRRAIELARAGGVDVMLLDLRMPGLDGLDVLREIRSEPGLRTLPVIIVTGSDAEADRVGGLDTGADDVVVKPVSLPELVARVRAQIRGRSAWTREVETDRAHRRRLAEFLPQLSHDAPLVALAVTIVDRLPAVIDVDALAILSFERTATRSVAASRDLAGLFPPTRLLPATRGSEIVARATSGPWLEGPSSRESIPAALELAFVPFRLGPAAEPIGCLVFGRRADPGSGPLSHRLADLIDATGHIVTVLRPSMEHAATTSAAVLELRQMISRRRFTTLLQPIVRLATGQTVGVEALTRFDDGVRPDVRFAEAARVGLGLPLERAALASAIDAAASLPPELSLSLNISPDALQHERALARILGTSKRPVIIELTEHERIDDYAKVRAALDRLGQGVRLAVDDAGSGYASLRHILTLRPAYVKLDMEWVRGIDDDPVRRSLVSGLAYFARETGCELIAEGIEREEERVALVELGVELGQGFLLGRPEPAARDPA
jgi:EAL domain-containing protein (putative c-di-GMP-specific phosphodiesterase class I)/DNA-binding NarL/FixJ family response regulator